MQNAIEIIYSQQSSDFIEGRAYANPRFFSTPRQGVTKVFIVGEWPKIRAAYEALGVQVEQLGEAPAAEAPVTAEPSSELAAKIRAMPKARKPKGVAPEPDRPGDMPSTQDTSEAEVDAQRDA